MKDITKQDKLTPREYEDYIEELIKQLSFTKHAKIHRNKKFVGVRQPGKYEIDIALEIKLDYLDFLIVVECKNWSKPVDRPVVQKFSQTRDALSAHKAVIVSPLGFTKEAIEVSKSLGIALWVISKAEWVKILGFPYFDETEETISKLRENISQRLEIDSKYLFSLNDKVLVEYESVLNKPKVLQILDKEIENLLPKENVDNHLDSHEKKEKWLRFRHYREVGSHSIAYNSPYLCRGDAISDIIDEILLYKHDEYLALLEKFDKDFFA